jgi:hypothetical protein
VLSKTQSISSTQLLVGLSVAVVGFLGARAGELMVADGLYARIGIFGYDPHCYHVVEVSAAAVAAFPSTKWKSAAYLVFAVGGEELASSVTYILYHLPSIIANPDQWPLDDHIFPYKVVAYVIVTAIGLFFLRKGVRFRLNSICCAGLLLYSAVLLAVMAQGYPVTALPQYSVDLQLNVLEMVGMAGWLGIIYGGIRPE